LAYIGNIPAESYASFETETFSVSATANYTLSHSVTNENEIRLVINGVVQQPGSGKAYTASGTTLTLTSATVSGDVMYAVYLGRALQTVNPPNASVGSAQIADSLISGKTALGATPADTDELLISDAGTLKRVDYSYLKSANTPIVMVRPSSNQAISSSTETQVVFDTEQIDTASAFTSNQFTVPSGQAGKYFIGATVIADNDADNSLQRVNIRSGSTTIAYGNFRLSGTDDNTMSVQTIVDLSVGDIIKVIYFSYQNASSIRSHGEYNNGTQLYICKLIS
jgi:hypothetical protein